MATTTYTVYYAVDSLCSFMLRYTIAIRGPANNDAKIEFEERKVDIHYDREHLSEFFLLKVNPKGQVPAITSPALEKPMPDSLDITNYLATMFPNLKPKEHETQIDEMLNKIHAQPYFVLSFGGHNAAPIPKGTVAEMKRILSEDKISHEYRKALETKLAGAQQVDFKSLFSPESVKKAEDTIGEFFRYVEENLPSSDGWLFGLPQPSAADAHLVALLARLNDVGREGLFPVNIKQYANKAKSTPEWQKVMSDLTTTMCPG